MRSWTLLLLGLLITMSVGVGSADELKVGDAAPATRVMGNDGRMHNLRESVGRSWLVVAWYPKAASKGCTAECNNLRDNVNAIASYRTVLFGASVDTPEDNRAFAEHNGYPFILLSDTSKTLAAQMGVLSAKGVAMRWTFIIDEKGVVRYINKSVNPATAMADLQNALEDLHVPKK